MPTTAVKPKVQTVSNRHIIFLSFVLLFSLILLHTYPDKIPIKNIKISVSSFFTPFNKTTSTTWQTPPPLRRDIPFIRDSPLANKLLNHSWTSPLILTTFARPLASNNSQTELFVYATGVSLGNFAREVSAAGCIIGDDVYDAEDELGEIYSCIIPRRVFIGERVSLVLRKDAALEHAMKGQQISGMMVTITEEDVVPLSDETRLHIADEALVKISQDARLERVAPPGGVLEKRSRYKVCMGTEMKTFPHLLKDWTSYHRKLGVDMVYILDNDAAEPLDRFVKGISGVEVVYWPFQKSQVQAMSYLLLVLRERCEWVLLIDADEYLLMGSRDDGDVLGVREFVDTVEEDVGQVYLAYVTMGVSGHVKMPEGHIPEEYLYKHTRQKVNGKVLARMDREWLSSRIHVHHVRGGEAVVRTQPKNDRPKAGDPPLLVHFQKRSYEEVLMKRSVGSASVRDNQIKTVKKIDAKVPKHYEEVREELRYTYFRDVWRLVETLEEKQVLVRVDADGERVTQVL